MRGLLLLAALRAGADPAHPTDTFGAPDALVCSHNAGFGLSTFGQRVNEWLGACPHDGHASCLAALIGDAAAMPCTGAGFDTFCPLASWREAMRAEGSCAGMPAAESADIGAHCSQNFVDHVCQWYHLSHWGTDWFPDAAAARADFVAKCESEAAFDPEVPYRTACTRACLDMGAQIAGCEAAFDSAVLDSPPPSVPPAASPPPPSPIWPHAEADLETSSCGLVTLYPGGVATNYFFFNDLEGLFSAADHPSLGPTRMLVVHYGGSADPVFNAAYFQGRDLPVQAAEGSLKLFFEEARWGFLL